MESKKFVISVHANDGAVLRVLGLIERRGHRVMSMRSHMPTSDTFHLEVEIEPGTPRQDVLIHQIKRLADVFNVLDINPRAQVEPKKLLPPTMRYSRHDAIIQW